MAGVSNFLPATQCLHLHASRTKPKEGILVGNPLRLSPLTVQSSTTSLSVIVRSSFNLSEKMKRRVLLSPKASVGSAEVSVEPATNVQFEKDLVVPGCGSSLVLLGTGYREKVFAIIGVKVYAAGFYVSASLANQLGPWSGESADEFAKNSSLFKSIFEEPSTKSLLIVLVRDVDGDTFWNALNDVISPRVKSPSAVDESALSTFRNVFLGRPLKKGSGILLTWAEPSKMLISISSKGKPTGVDADIESINVTAALFDAFFGDSPVSPTLKTSSAGGLEMLLKEILAPPSLTL